MHIAHADSNDPSVRTLIELHQRDMAAASPPGTSFALDVSGLKGPEVTLFGAWIEGGRGSAGFGCDTCLAGIGALKRFGDGQAEIKSMRTHPAYLGRGVARALLEAIIATAQGEGINRLSLETGTSDQFTPAIRLYTRRGFAPGDAFADYSNGPYNQCYHLML